MKTCSKCKISKDLSQFCKKLSGLGSRCRACISVINLAQRAAKASPKVLRERAVRKEQKELRKALREKLNLKLCNQCIVLKSCGSFYTHSGGGNSQVEVCKECCRKNEKRRKATNPDYPLQRKRTREKLRAHPEIRKAYHLKDSFGISLECYERKLAEQGGKCAICKTDGSLLKRKLAVDHDHKTGKIRGLLCGSCNTALGSLKDSFEIVQAAANYLRYHARLGKEPEFDRTD